MAMAVANRLLYPRVLIVAPKSVFTVWQKAIREEGSNLVEYWLTNYDQLTNRSTRKKLRTWLRASKSMVILDEAHRIKRRGSKQSKACRTFARVTTYRLALTGTPIAQGIQDTWAIFDFIEPGLFGKFEEFQERYLEMGGYQGRKVVGTKRLKEFMRILHEHSARIRLKEVSKKPVRIRRLKHYVELEPSARRHYEELERELVTETRKLRVETPLVIMLSMRLQQICGGFLSDGVTTQQISSAKLWALAQHLRHGQPQVICCRFLAEMDLIEQECLKHRLPITIIKGGQPLTEPFTEGVAIVQIQSGLGIDLSAAKQIIWYSWDYSFINYEQMRFRVLSRIQTQVDYRFLLVKNTIDDLIYEAVTSKRRLSDLVCDHYRRMI